MPASSLTYFTLPSHNHFNKIPIFSHLPNHNTFSFKLQKPVKKLHLPPKPASKYSLLTHFSSPQKFLTKTLVEKTAVLLLGSLIFMGSIKARPVLAQPVQETQSFEQTSSGDSEEEVMCVKLLEENPKNVDVLKRVVNVKMRRGKTKEAVEYVEKLVDAQPNEMEWRLLQALCYEMMGNLSKAKSLFKDILKQKPLLLRALHGLAMVMHKNREGPAVFEMLERALEIAHREKRVNEERNIRILLAQMHIVKGDLEEALEKFRALVDENPRDFRPYLCQGIVYSLLDKRKEADENFAIYKSLVPEEFPQRGFLDDVVLAAKSESKQQLEKDLQR